MLQSVPLKSCQKCDCMLPTVVDQACRALAMQPAIIKGRRRRRKKTHKIKQNNVRNGLGQYEDKGGEGRKEEERA